MDRNSFRRYFGDQRKLKRIVDFLIMNQKLTRPRWYVRMLMPLYQRRAWSATIYRSVRMDTPPYRQFAIGKRSVVESFACINNAVGDVLIGDYSRVGLHSTVIGPVTIGSHVNLAQGVVITALNHNFSDSSTPIDAQGVATSKVTVGDDVWIGANAVVLPGVTIGSHSVVEIGRAHV